MISKGAYACFIAKWIVTLKKTFIRSNSLVTGILPVWLIFPAILSAQEKIPISLTYQNHQTAKPFSEMGNFVQKPIHSGFTLGTAFNLNKDTVHKLKQTAKLGYLYHQYNQKAIQLFSELDYQHHFATHWSGIARLGAGYMHSFPDVETFSLNGNGQYEENPNSGRPQLMVTGSIGIQYHLKKRKRDILRIRLTYQPWLQYPFVNEYVPLLPYSTFSIGLEKPIRWSHEDE